MVEVVVVLLFLPLSLPPTLFFSGALGLPGLASKSTISSSFFLMEERFLEDVVEDVVVVVVFVVVVWVVLSVETDNPSSSESKQINSPLRRVEGRS